MGLQLTRGTRIQSPRRTAIARLDHQRLHAGLAQLVEHLICNQGVTGSNPVAGTNIINELDHFNYCDFATSKHIVSTLNGVVSISPSA